MIFKIKIVGSKTCFLLTQSYYIEKMLNKLSYRDCKLINTPFNTNCKMRANTGPKVNQLVYSRVIASLIYVIGCTMSDIIFTAGMPSHYTNNLEKMHWEGIGRVMRYIKGTMNMDLHKIGFPVILEGFSDLSWNSDLDKSKSNSGYIFTFD